jgi:citrate lyase subunit alpha/citrate CoA-transferase
MQGGVNMFTSIGREIPDDIAMDREIRPFKGAFAYTPSGTKATTYLSSSRPGEKKIVNSLKEVIQLVGLEDGMTISFHHHLRFGDYVINLVLDTIAEMGIKDLTFTATGHHPIPDSFIRHIENGVITRIEHTIVLEELGTVAAKGLLKRPIVVRSHGGRPRAIEAGDLPIDVSFIAAPTADTYGNINGVDGPSFCGALGYAVADAQYARKVVAVTNNLVDYPLDYISIPQTDVDYVVVVDKIGDPTKIASGGGIRMTKDPRDIKIAQDIIKVIEASGLIKNGFSFQAGTGGISLAVTKYLENIMKKNDVRGSFLMGGITSSSVDLLRKGLFKVAFDVQSFDLGAAASLRQDRNHIEVSASMYANPHNKGCIVNMLDIVILSTLEVDTKFNANVLTGSDGIMRTGPGGHSDASAGAKLTILATPLLRGRIPVVVEDVVSVTAPGETIDVVVTEYGVAVNPARHDLIELLKDAGVKLVRIEDLRVLAEKIAGKPKQLEVTDKVIGIVEYRDGSIIDVVRQPLAYRE